MLSNDFRPIEIVLRVCLVGVMT